LEVLFELLSHLLVRLEFLCKFSGKALQLILTYDVAVNTRDDFIHDYDIGTKAQTGEGESSWKSSQFHS
jgi:hypothetical protein